MELNNKNLKTLELLREAINNGSVIYIAVSFITRSGIEMLFENIDVWNKKILVITTNDENITNQESIDKLLELGAEIRIINKELNNVGFHAKFLAVEGQKNFALGGSFNLTEESFTNKIETILKIEFEDAKKNFANLWNIAHDYSKVNFVDRDLYENSFKDADNLDVSIIPNSMQEKTLVELETLIKNGKNKFLLWAATATGKTITSLLFREKLKNPKTLFIANQTNIIESAYLDYQKNRPSWNMKIFKKMNDFSNNDIAFATDKLVEKTIRNKPELLEEYTLLIIDETHHLGPGTNYESVFNFFDKEEKNVFGMTATPRRTKDPLHVILKYGGEENLVGKITPEVALKENIIVPMKYYDIKTDSEFDIQGDLKNVVEMIRSLKTSDGGKLKALFFVNSIINSRIVTELLCKYGINALAINSKDKQYDLKNLQDMMSDEKNSLEALVTVDKFNEGVDLPSLNTIVMLRKTESKIIYTQQIGRVLRKNKDKAYANVIDVVNNKEVNFECYIPLFGIDKDIDPLKTLSILMKLANTKEDKDGRIVLETDGGNTFSFEKFDEKSIIKMISNLNIKTKLIDYYKDHILKESLVKGNLRLSEVEELTGEKIQLISNTFRSGGSFKFEEELPWIVKYFEEFLEVKKINYTNKLSKKDKVVIELLSWLPITASSLWEKQDILKLINGHEVKMTHKWLSYFSGSYYNEKNKLVSSKLLNPEYYEIVNSVFTVNFDNLTIKFNYASNEAYSFYFREIINYLKNNLRDDNFRVNTWYSPYEMSFMLGFVVTVQGGDFKTFKLESQSLGGRVQQAIKASVKNKKDKNFNNYIVDNSTIVFSRAKDKPLYKKEDNVHLFLNSDGGVSKKYFTNAKMHLYVGSANLESKKLIVKEFIDSSYYYTFKTNNELDYKDQALLKY